MIITKIFNIYHVYQFFPFLKSQFSSSVTVFNLKGFSRLGSCFLGLRLQHLPLDPLRQQRLFICRETHLTHMGVHTSCQVYLRAQDTRPHNHQDQPAEQTSLFHLFWHYCVPLAFLIMTCSSFPFLYCMYLFFFFKTLLDAQRLS